MKSSRQSKADMSLELPGSCGYASNELILVFLDIMNMEAITRDLGEQAARDALDQWTRVLKFLGLQYDGFLIRRMGTSLLFSFPEGKPALDGVKAFMDLIPGDTKTPSATPRFRAGIHSGNVSGTRSAEAVKAAAKLVAVAAEGEVLVSGSAVHRVDSAHRLRLQPYGGGSGAAVLAGLNPYRYNWRREPSSIPMPTAFSRVAVTHVDTAALSEEPPTRRPEPAGPRIPLAVLADAAEQISGHRRLETEEYDPGLSPRHTQLRRTTVIHNGATHHVSPRKPLLTIGRETDNDIVVSAPTASRYHATIRFAEGRFLYIDKSSNGSFLYPGDDDAEHVAGESRVLEGTGRVAPGCPSEHENAEVLFYKVGSVY